MKTLHPWFPIRRVCDPVGYRRAFDGWWWLLVAWTLAGAQVAEAADVMASQMAESLAAVLASPVPSFFSPAAPSSVPSSFPASSSSGASLGFSQSLERILGRSTSLAQSSLQWEGLRARNIPTRFSFLPKISLRSYFPVNFNALNVSKSVAFNGEWNLFRGGGDYFALRQAMLSEESAQWGVDVAWLEAEQEAVEKMVFAIRSFKEVIIFQKMIHTQEQALKLAQERFAKGFLPVQELQKIEIDLANTGASLADAQVRQIQAAAQLTALLGDATLQAQWPWIAPLTRGRAQALLQEKLTLEQRPDWMAAQTLFDVQAEKVHQAWTNFLPTLDGQFSWGYTHSNYGGVDQVFTGWSATLFASLPIFDHFKNYADLQASKLEKIATETRILKLQRDAQSQWSQAQASLQTELQSALAREKVLQLAARLYQDNLRRFQSGRITANDLNIDRNRVNSAELLAVQGWSSVHLSFSSLCHALGYRLAQCLE